MITDLVTGTDSSKTLVIGDMLKSEDGAKAFVNLQIGTSEFRQMLQTDELIDNTIQLVQTTIKRIKADLASNAHGKKQQDLDAFHSNIFKHSDNPDRQQNQQPQQGQQPAQGQQPQQPAQQQAPAQNPQQQQNDLHSNTDLA